jgi:hypothetical protein
MHSTGNKLNEMVRKKQIQKCSSPDEYSAWRLICCTDHLLYWLWCALPAKCVKPKNKWVDTVSIVCSRVSSLKLLNEYECSVVLGLDLSTR